MKKRLFFLVFVVVVFTSNLSSADVFKFFGPRPSGMGGAYVAVAEDGLAQYWNPAGLGVKAKEYNVRAPDVGFSIEMSKDTFEKVENISALSDKIDSLQGKIAAGSMSLDDYDDFTNILSDINALSDQDMGVLGNVYGGVNVKGMQFSLSVNNYNEFSGSPLVDLNNINFASGMDAAPSGIAISAPESALISARDDLTSVISDLSAKSGMDLAGLTPEQAANAVINNAVASSVSNETISDTVSTIKENYDATKDSLPTLGSGSFVDNQTSLVLRGASILEVSLGVGGKIAILEDTPVLKDSYFGINAKLLKSRVGYGRINVLDNNADINDTFENMSNNTKVSTNFTFDLGYLYDKKEELGFRVGLLLRNITAPTLAGPTDDLLTSDVEGDDTAFKLNAQARLGFAYWLTDYWVTALDFDLTEHDTALINYKSRTFSLGTEFKFINTKEIDFSLRAGLFKNLAESEAPISFTAGFGLTMMYVNFDIAGAASSKTVRTGSGTVPASAGVSMALSVLF